MTLLAVFTTLPNADSAREMARILVEHHLVACAQLDAIESFYYWDGALHHAPEYRLTLKTTVALYAAVEAAILERHPYELPAIFALPVVQVLNSYDQWIQKNCAKAE